MMLLSFEIDDSMEDSEREREIVDIRYMHTLRNNHTLGEM